MGTVQTWRKAYGALKDHTKVGLAHVNSDYKDVDVAIVKATNHVECPPKERHIKKMLVCTSEICSRADVAYCIHALARRLTKTQNWTVALKTLIVIHRILREGNPTFREELLNFQQGRKILQMSSFKDDSSSIAWDCSAWVRTYALFLEERLESFNVLKYDIESECLSRPSQAQDKAYCRTRDLDNEELLEQLPALQQLLYRLIGCRPEGAAMSNYVIQYALVLVLKESFKIYCAIYDGIINLVDKFFEMPRHEAIKALDIYKRAGQQAGYLSDFYEVCKGLKLARNFQFPVLREPPQSFLVTIEEYIKEAPRMVSVPSVTLEYSERLMLTCKQEDDSLPSEDAQVVEKEAVPPPSADPLIPNSDATVHPPPPTHLDTEDLLGLNVTARSASSIKENDMFALAIVPPGTTPFDADSSLPEDFTATGWELALVTTPSTDLSSAQESQSAGGTNSLILDSLFDNGEYRASQQPIYGEPAPNPFEVADPFAMPDSFPSQTVQTAAPFEVADLFAMSSSFPSQTVQTAATTQRQNNLLSPFQLEHTPTDQQYSSMTSTQNPFEDIPASHLQAANNPFGDPGILR